MASSTISFCSSREIFFWHSRSTVKNYCSAITPFLLFFQSRNYKQVTKEDVEGFMYHQITKYKIFESAQNTMINAIKTYYEQVLGKERTVYEIRRPKKSKTLPNILSQEEVQAIFRSIGNPKHKAIIMTLYSAGLRISEALKFRITKSLKMTVNGAGLRDISQTQISKQNSSLEPTETSGRLKGI
jgi:site-specific recombinase XerD